MARHALLLTLLLCLGAAPTAAAASANEPSDAAGSRFAAPLRQHLARLAADETVVAWIHLRDKGPASKARVPHDVVTSRCLARRAKVLPMGRLVGPRDLPVHAAYVDAIRQRVSRLRHATRWFNAVSVEATGEELEQVAALPFVRRIDHVAHFQRRPGTPEHGAQALDAPAPDKLPPSSIHSLNYGPSNAQLSQIGVPALHDMGYSGQGVLIGHFDNGHRLLSHEAFQFLDILATHDFVSGDDDPAPNPSDPINFGAHGISTLSALAGYHAGDLIGPAYGATYLLARTENDAGETPVEEDNWLAAMEWADSLGVDVLSTSLVYLEFQSPYVDWTWEDMDGNTTLITRASDLAVSLGIVVVNAAGNEGLPLASEGNSLGAPADGDSVITVGSVNANGLRASYSSVGPTTDGRIKPDVMALGTVYCASAYSSTGYGYVTGTSMATPLVAGVAALLLSARPTATPMLIRDALRETASQASTPDNFMGWGIIDAEAALSYLDSSSTQETTTPAATRLLRNVPNPFNPGTTVSFELARPAHVMVQVFDVRGQLVRTLIDADLPARRHEVVWDGRRSSGAAAASGTYFARLHAEHGDSSATESTRKMTLVR
jgi:subtilisin family serine protease